MYDKQKIEQISKEYIETLDELVFERLIEELESIIRIQLGKNYSSLKEYWDDMQQEVILKLWKNKSSVAYTKTTQIFSYYYQRIRGDLNRAAKRIKNDYMIELPEEYIKMIEETGGGYHLDEKDYIDNIEGRVE